MLLLRQAKACLNEIMLSFLYLKLILYSMTKTGPSLPECLLPSWDCCSGGSFHLLLMGSKGERALACFPVWSTACWATVAFTSGCPTAEDSVGEHALAKFAHLTQSLLGGFQQSSPVLAWRGEASCCWEWLLSILGQWKGHPSSVCEEAPSQTGCPELLCRICVSHTVPLFQNVSEETFWEPPGREDSVLHIPPFPIWYQQ